LVLYQARSVSSSTTVHAVDTDGQPRVQEGKKNRTYPIEYLLVVLVTTNGSKQAVTRLAKAMTFISPPPPPAPPAPPMPPPPPTSGGGGGGGGGTGGGGDGGGGGGFRSGGSAFDVRMLQPEYWSKAFKRNTGDTPGRATATAAAYMSDSDTSLVQGIPVEILKQLQELALNQQYQEDKKLPAQQPNQDNVPVATAYFYDGDDFHSPTNGDH